MSLGFIVDERRVWARKKYHDTDLSHIGFDPDLTASTDTSNSADLLARLARHQMTSDQ